MVRTLTTIAVLGPLLLAAVPASATILTLPVVGDIENPDLDPFHIVTPEPAAAPAAPAPMKKHHHHHHKMKKAM
jgi:hypothetical protein